MLSSPPHYICPVSCGSAGRGRRREMKPPSNKGCNRDKDNQTCVSTPFPLVAGDGGHTPARSRSPAELTASDKGKSTVNGAHTLYTQIKVPIMWNRCRWNVGKHGRCFSFSSLTHLPKISVFPGTKPEECTTSQCKGKVYFYFVPHTDLVKFFSERGNLNSSPSCFNQIKTEKAQRSTLDDNRVHFTTHGISDWSWLVLLPFMYPSCDSFLGIFLSLWETFLDEFAERPSRHSPHGSK